jgi:hypothetical protein
MKNNNIKKYIVLLFSVLFLSNCSDYIDIENQNNISADPFYRDETELNLALNGSYSTLRAPIAFEWMLSEVRSDNTFMNNVGSTNAQNLQIYSNDIFQAPSFDLFIERYWATTYTSIRSVNGLLAGLKTSYNPASGVINYDAGFNIPVDGNTRKRIAGEASFMRAYHYFNLVRLYGGVFLIDKVTTADQALDIPRSSVDDIYKFIIADLKNASANCISSTFAGTAAADKGKATSWAAKALLAKVYLTLGQKADALPLLTDVITSSGYSILTGTTGYSNVFSATNELNAEMLFAIRFKAGGLGYGSSLANLFGPIATNIFTPTGLVNPAGTEGGYNNPTADLYNSYGATDIRRNYNVKLYKPSTTAAATLWTYWSGKHNGPTSIQNDSELDWPVLRFSDVLLMYCEAVGSANTTTLGYLNQVHVRAGLTAFTLANISTTASYELAVANERRWEFAMENQRWFDLLRFDKTFTTIKAKTVMDNHFSAMISFYSQYDNPFTLAQLQANTADPKFLLLPIPNIEIITNTKNRIPQNAGY